MRRIVICGEVYSPNVGDAVISDSLKHIIHLASPSVDLDVIDLSGRLGFVDGPNNNHGLSPPSNSSYRRQILSVLANASRPLRRLARWHMGEGRRVWTYWAGGLIQRDLLIIGGGQLLMDNALDFPLKLLGLTELARRSNVPVAFHACGVGRWSALGAIAMRKALSRAISISVRDSASYSKLVRYQAGSAVQPKVTWDPAVWSGPTYGINRLATSNIIGLGITAPQNLNLRIAEPSAMYSTSDLIDYWALLAKRLTEDGLPIKLFTNGEYQDQLFANEVARRLRSEGISEANNLVADRPTGGEALVRQIGQFALVIAHRLHANIIAFALGIPSIGLVWDNKVWDFYVQIQQEAFCTRSRPELLGHTLELAKRRLNGTYNPASAARARSDALQDISCLLGVETPNVTSS